MGDILGLIICLLFVGALFFLFLGLFFLVVIRPVITWEVYRKHHKIQWKCEKSNDSVTCNTYFLYYRTLPSDIGKYTRIYGDNPWIRVDKFDKSTFNSKEDFIEFVKSYQTREDIKKFIIEENGWIYP